MCILPLPPRCDAPATLLMPRVRRCEAFVSERFAGFRRGSVFQCIYEHRGSFTDWTHPPCRFATNIGRELGYRTRARESGSGERSLGGRHMEPTNRRDFLKHASVAAAAAGPRVAAPVTIADAASALPEGKEGPAI